jgi:hypothetical protein
LIVLVLEDLEEVVDPVLAHGAVVGLNLGLQENRRTLQVLLKLILKKKL